MNRTYDLKVVSTGTSCSQSQNVLKVAAGAKTNSSGWQHWERDRPTRQDLLEKISIDMAYLEHVALSVADPEP